MSRPWDETREFWWYSLATSEGVVLGMFLGGPDLTAWVDRHPGRSWRVGLWRGHGLIGLWAVEARPGKPGKPKWREIESRAERRRKGGGDGSDK